MQIENFNIDQAYIDFSSLNKNSGFFMDVLEGLTSSHKYLSSKYFYDVTGDKLFQDIMSSEEYYPFQCEMEIFNECSAEIVDTIMSVGKNFDLIELGAGDGTKSIQVLKQLTHIKTDFTYIPIDISPNVINYLCNKLTKIIPGIKVIGLNGDYFDMLEKANNLSQRRKVILFMGSNLGNMHIVEAMDFCRRMRSLLQPGDMVVVGLDLKKDPATILAAYNDKGGITKAFNLNLLSRINRELNADFNLNQFEHYPTYDPESGTCKSYLISRIDQVVNLNGEKAIHFAKDEYIHMEISQKYTVEEINELAEVASFRTEKRFFDSRKWFVDVVWKAI